MVKPRKNKNKETAPKETPAAEAVPSSSNLTSSKKITNKPTAETVPSTSNLTPSKKIKKQKKVKGNKNKDKREGVSDVVTAVPNVSAAAADNNNSKNEQKSEKKSGFIFMCNSRTKPECYRNKVFGMPKGKAELVQRIKPGTRLFLYDFDLRLMYGVYRAASQGGMNLVPEAFGGAFPAQVKFKIDKDCLPLPENIFKQAMLENYDSKNKFQPDLNSKQVHKLVTLFQPITAAPQPVPPQFMEERHAPPPAHVPTPADSYRSGRLPPAYLPPPEDPYRSSAHLTPPNLPLPEDPYRSRRLFAPTHLPPAEDPYLGRVPAPDSRYIPVYAPPANDPYYSAAHYAHVPPTVAQNVDPYHPSHSSYMYHQSEAPRAYYAENLIPSSRLDYRVPSEMTERDPNAAQARDYQYLLRRDGDVPRADHLEDPCRPDHVIPSSTYERPLLSSYRIQQHYDPLVYSQGHSSYHPSQPSASVPVSSRYSFAGAAPAHR